MCVYKWDQPENLKAKVSFRVLNKNKQVGSHREMIHVISKPPFMICMNIIIASLLVI